MIKVNIHEIKAQLSKFIDLVEAGETVVVCKRNIPVAEIRATAKKDKRKPILGSAAGTFDIPSDFDKPMSGDELALWEETSSDDPLKEFSPKSRRPKR